MKAIVLNGTGGPEVLTIGDVPRPEPKADDLLVRVRASALNRADTLQRRGLYPPPPGDSDILGLELAGEVAGWGANVSGFKEGERVFGLVGGGGYGEYALLDAHMAMPIPDGWDFLTAAAVPEVFFTANETVFVLGGLQSGETLLVHAGGSGVGTAAIQMAHGTPAPPSISLPAHRRRLTPRWRWEARRGSTTRPTTSWRRSSASPAARAWTWWRIFSGPPTLPETSRC